MRYTSNPALASADRFQGLWRGRAERAPAVATVQGVVNKTAILVLITVVAGAGGYALVARVPSITWISPIAAFMIVLGLGFLRRGRPQAAPLVGPIYALVEGVFLGSLTGALDTVLARMPALAGAVAAGQDAGARVSLAMPAFLITVAVLVAMLGLYYEAVKLVFRLYLLFGSRE